MRKAYKWFSMLLVAFMVMQPVLGMAGLSTRVIPTGKVSVLEDGKAVSQFQSEMPLPQGKLMACDGNCLVQADTMQLVAHDKAVFSAAESKSQWDLALNEGRMDFTLGSQAKPLAVRTPDDMVQIERVAGSKATGYVVVTEKGTQVVVHEGSFQVAGRNGTQVIEAGQSMTIARADTDKSDDGMDADAAVGGAAGGGFAAGFPGGAAGMVAAGAAAAGAVAGGVAATSSHSGSGDGGQDLSPSALPPNAF